MNPEAEQPDTAEGERGGGKPEAKRRAGVPVWRVGKPDAFLAAAVDVARTAIEGITAPSDIGEHIAAKSEGDRLVTHLFESKLPGYQGWQWYAVVTRNSRSKVVTVSELGLLPSADSILSPEWVPWAERVRPEDAQAVEEEPAHGEPTLEEPAGGEPGGNDEPDTDRAGEHEPVGEAD
ncbi:MAG: hypothetical protein NVS2B15_00800 [Pseudarthrobacter sp.]